MVSSCCYSVVSVVVILLLLVLNLLLFRSLFFVICSSLSFFFRSCGPLFFRASVSLIFCTLLLLFLLFACICSSVLLRFVLQSFRPFHVLFFRVLLFGYSIPPFPVLLMLCSAVLVCFACFALRFFSPSSVVKRMLHNKCRQ